MMTKFDSINVIPFIDIMLVLLAIVLTTATFVKNGELKIDLPVSKSSDVSEKIVRVEIAINSEGVRFIDGVETSVDEMESLLQVLSTDKPILLLIDENVQFKQFMSVIDILKRLSLDKLSILTRTKI